MSRVPSTRKLCIMASASCILGVLMIGTSFGINTGPPLGASDAQLIVFAATNFRAVLWGAWLQALGPLLIVGFAFTLVYLAGETGTIAGWMTMLGASILMIVTLAEVTFNISALDSIPASMGMISNNIGHAIQHLYFFVAAPALFFPLGVVLRRSQVLPRVLGGLSQVLAAAFFVLGMTSLYDQALSPRVTALAAVQALWWAAAAVSLIVRSGRLTGPDEVEGAVIETRNSVRCRQVPVHGLNEQIDRAHSNPSVAAGLRQTEGSSTKEVPWQLA